MPNHMRRSVLACLAVTLAAGVRAESARWEFTVDGVAREAWIDLPAATNTPAPVVFAFHGHGGSARNARNTFEVRRHWPEAIAVYMQGLPTPGRLTDPEGKKAGWQHGPGELGNRDIAFFDAVLERLKRELKVDERRIHCTGHSNGGAFTYTLWRARGEVFAAVAPSACVAPWGGRGLTPKPVLHLAGEKDALVKFAWQSRSLADLRQLNRTGETGKPWAEHATLYDSDQGPPFVAFVHPGSHAFPAGGAALIARFFQENPGPAPAEKP